MSDILQVNNLVKKYGRNRALDSVSFNIEKGKIVGLLGPNGSGKTTFIKIAAGLLKQSSGDILINGLKIGDKTKNIVSYMPDEEFLYNWMKIKDAIEFFKDFFRTLMKKRLKIFWIS